MSWNNINQCAAPNELNDTVNTYDMLRFIFEGSVNETTREQQNSPDESYSYNTFPDNFQAYSSNQNYPINDKINEINDVWRCTFNGPVNILSNDKTTKEQNQQLGLQLHFNENFSSADTSYMFPQEEYNVSTVEPKKFKQYPSTQDYSINDESNETNDMLLYIVDEHVNTVSTEKTTEQQMEPVTQLHPHDSLPSSDATSKIILETDVSTINKSLLNICTRKGSCDNSQMIVETSGNNAKGKRLCCVYCHKRYVKLARHLESVHKGEAEVKKFLALPKKSKQRREIQDSLRKQGCFEWNTNASINNGVLCTSRRPNGKVLKSATDIKTCPKCVGTYAVTGFRNHFNKCTNGALKGERCGLVLSRTVEGRVHANANDRLATEIFPGMEEDDIVRLARYDYLIIIYGNHLSIRYKEVSQLGLIRNKIRMAGRLCAAVKSECPFVTDFASTFRPKCYNSMLAAIKSDLGKFDLASNEYGVCSPVLAAVTEVRKIARMLIVELIKLEGDNMNQQRNVENFVTLMDSYETSTMLKTVRQTQKTRKRVKKQNIPSNEDVHRLATYIKCERTKYFNQLSEKFDFSVWLELSKMVVASIIVFNRKRTGETQKILLSDFIARQSIDKDCQLPLYAALSEEEKKVVRKFSQMKINGKLDVEVPVLLSHNMEKSIQLLLKHREDAGVNNKFLFGLPSKGRIKVVNSCEVIADLSKKCGADNPESLRGTKLRMHLASFCITMDLDDVGVDEVAKHMGHSVGVHRKYYRHNPLDRDIVRMSKRLQAAQGMSDNVDTDTDDTDLEDDVNKENFGVDIIRGSTEERPCQSNEVNMSTKTSAGRKREKEEEESRGHGDGISEAKLPKKKWSDNQMTQKKKTKTCKV